MPLHVWQNLQRRARQSASRHVQRLYEMRPRMQSGRQASVAIRPQGEKDLYGVAQPEIAKVALPRVEGFPGIPQSRGIA